MASILRTGKLLRYFAGFTRNVVVNSVRDSEGGSLLQNAPCMCSQFQQGFANNAAPKADINLDKHIRKLDNDVRRIGRISRRDIEEVLDELRTHRTATSSQSLLMIRCCGNLVPEELPEVRTALVLEIWKTLNSLDVSMDISHYNALLRVYLENEHTFSPTDFLGQIEAKGIEPNRVTYQRLITRYCQQGDIEGATRILEFMRGKNLPVNENVFNSLILGHSQANDLESAKGILGVMKQAGLEPSAETYTTLLCAYARHGDMEALEKTLADCEKQDIVLLDKDLLDVIFTLTIHGNGDQVDVLLPKIRVSAGFNQEAVSVILRLVNHGYEDVGLKILRIMPRNTRINGMPIDVGAFFVRQLVKVNRPVEKILGICKLLHDEGLNTRALQIAADAGLSNGIINNALPLLKEMKNVGLPIRQHYFWPLICSVESNQVLNVVRRMQEEFSMNPNTETVRDYIIPNLKEKNWEKVLILLRDNGISGSTAVISIAYSALSSNQLVNAAEIMEKNRVYFIPHIFKQPLIQALGKTNDYESFTRCVRQLYESVQNRQRFEATQEEGNNSEADATPTSESTFDVVGSIVYEASVYFRRERDLVLENLLPNLVNEGLSISSEYATRISERLGEEMTPKIAEMLGKLSSGELELRPLKNSVPKRRIDMLTVDELERFIIKEEAKGADTTNIKRHLLNACFRSHNLEKALQVIEKLKNEGYNITQGISAQLIDLYTYHKRNEEALSQFEKLKNEDPEFKLDNIKTVRLFNQLLLEERLDDGLKLLESNKKPHLLTDTDRSFNYDSTVWRILNSLAEKGDAQQLQRVFDCLLECNYILPNNILLGPLIKVHLVKDDIKNAIETFEQICLKYKTTPWKNELACRLIQNEDADNLQKLTDLSTGIHGEVNSLYDLVFSFVECGRVRQARKILETPGLRMRPYRINNACERYKSEGMVQPLEGLIEATKDLAHIDRNKIYYTLLLSYNKTDSADKALCLWMKMQEEAIAPTDAFLIQLADLLKRNNKAIPFVVPEAAKQRSRHLEPAEAPPIAASPIVQQRIKQTEQNPEKQPTLRKLIQSGDIDGALNLKHRLPSVNVHDISLLIEQLVRAKRLTEATKFVDELLAEKKHPIAKIFKFYINKIAEAGDVATMKRIGLSLSDEQKKILSFDNRYCNANIAAGKAEEYMRHLAEEIDAVQSPDDAAMLATKFPHGGAVGILEKHPEMIAQYEKVAEKYAEHNHLGPINVLWMHLILLGDEAASKAIWNKYLSTAPRLMFQRVLQTAREQKDDKLVDLMITQLRESKISEGAIGNTYSCLIDIQTDNGNVDKAMDTLKTAIKDVSLEHINRTALQRLKLAVESQKQEFPYSIPEKKNKLQSSSSSDSSSDDDIKPKRPETRPAKPDQKDLKINLG